MSRLQWPTIRRQGFASQIEGVTRRPLSPLPGGGGWRLALNAPCFSPNLLRSRFPPSLHSLARTSTGRRLDLWNPNENSSSKRKACPLWEERDAEHSAVQALFSVQLIAGLIIIGMVLLLAAALAVPFLFPTETLWYKAGADKLMLLTAQMAGLLALVLLLVQILLALRPKVFMQVLGTAALLRWHRANGVVLAGCALVHVVLVLAPEGFENLPLGWKFWPELLGAVTLFFLLTTVAFPVALSPASPIKAGVCCTALLVICFLSC